MTISAFGEAYSSFYDLIYADKDYEGECELIEAAFDRFSALRVNRVLDLGCGTGNHAWRLACRGYQVIGVDLSEPMLKIARQKKDSFRLPAGTSAPLFIRGDVRRLNLRVKFEAVLALFAVLGYQPENEDVLAFLQTVEKHLEPGGLFLADFWYGPAVEAIKPEVREKVIAFSQGRLIRQARPRLCPEKNQCLVHYHLLMEKEDGSIAAEFEENHLMRYFYKEEIEPLLELSGLKFLHLSAFGDLARPAGPDTWNVLLVAKK